MAEHARLKDAVVEAAKARRLTELRYFNHRGKAVQIVRAKTNDAEIEVVDALIAFEREHKIGRG